MILGLVNITFLIQLRRISIDNESNKRRDQKIIDLTAENESLRYQYTQLLSFTQKLEGENVTYKKFHEHPVV